jgi:hypothetical protein
LEVLELLVKDITEDELTNQVEMVLVVEAAAAVVPQL